MKLVLRIVPSWQDGVNNGILLVPKMLDTTEGKWKTTNLCQKTLAILISCSGVALMIGYGLILAIISQSLLIFLSIFD
jgi:hypothetical protein